MKKIIVVFIISMLMVVSCGATPTPTQTPTSVIYVSPNGSDENVGTLTSPFETVAQAIDSGASEVVLREGVYPYLEIRTPNVTVRSFAGEQVIIRPASGTFAAQVAYDAENVTLQGLVIDAENVDNTALKITSGAHDVSIINCEVLNAHNSHGVLVSNGSYNVSIIGGSVHDNGGVYVAGQSNNYHGIYLSSTYGNIIDGVEVYRNTGHAVHIYGSGSGYANTVQNSYLHDNNIGIGAYYGNVVIRNNVLEHDGNYLIRMQYNLENVTVSGNDLSFPAPNWTSLYVADFNGTATITQNRIHDSYLGLWVRKSGTGTVYLTSNVIDANTPLLKQNTEIQVIDSDNE